MLNNKTIYFLVPYPFQEAPSQRFRFEQYLSYFEQEGMHVEVHPFLDDATWKTLYSKGNVGKKAMGILKSFARRVILLFRLRNADYLFIHREAAQLGPPIFEWIIVHILRKKYIYDFDDAIWLPNYSETNKRFQRLKAYWKVNYCMKWAWKISAGNAYLADYARKFNNNVYIIPTTIDTDNHHNVCCNQDSEDIVIGWTGTHTTMHYLDALIPVIQSLEEKYTFTFLVISNEKPSYTLKSLRFIKWNKDTEIEDLATMNIGVMPLEQDNWSDGKCGFKGLQYMALEIAPVMSPVGVNPSIVSDGVNGFLAATPEEWKEKLTRLIESNTLRKQFGKAARETVEQAYSVNANKQRYLELLAEDNL